MENQIKKVQEFLRRFDDPVLKLLPDPKAPRAIKNVNVHRDLSEYLALNNEYPSGLYFTPNGRFGLVNQVGTQVQFSQSIMPKKATISALCLDRDLKDFEGETMETLLKMIKEKMALMPIQPKYIVMSGGGYHAYWIIHPKDRLEAFECYGVRLLEISQGLAERLGADANAKVSSSPAALIRVPWTQHWKTGKSIQSRIVFESDSLLTLDMIDKSMTYITQQKEAREETRLVSKTSPPGKYKEISEIPMDEIIDKLRSYPRTIDGKQEYFSLEGSQVIINVIGGEQIRRNSYKWNRAENYIHCFYQGDMARAPEGNGYGFLFWYFNKSKQQAVNFLRNEFNIDLSHKQTGLGALNAVYEEYGFTVLMYEGGVTLEKTKVTPKGEESRIITVIFRNAIEVFGKGFVRVAGLGEQEEQRAYVMNVDGDELMVIPKPAKRDHNKAYNTRFFFYGDDNDMGLFYSALNNSDKIEEIDIHENSGYYNDTVILGGNLLAGTLGKNKILARQPFEIVKGLTQISAREYFDKFRLLYDDEIAIPAMLQAIALAGMNLWEGFNTYPSLLISGKTGSGKSAILVMLKQMLGYNATARVMSLPGITPQPLKQAASDYSILFLEELTQKVGQTTEELLRNIVNRDKAARGLPDGNVEFVLRSPIFVVGERSFKDESLNNRFVSIVSSRRFWKEGAKSLVDDILGYTAYEDIYNTYLQNKDNLSELAKGYASILSERGLDSRTADTWSFIYVINDLFGFNFEFEELFAITESTLKRTGADEGPEDNSRETLRVFIIRLLSQRTANLVISDAPGVKLRFEITFLEEDIYQKARTILGASIMDINGELNEPIIRANASGIFFMISGVKDHSGRFKETNSQVIVDFIDNIINSSPKGSAINDLSGRRM